MEMNTKFLQNPMATQLEGSGGTIRQRRVKSQSPNPLSPIEAKEKEEKPAISNKDESEHNESQKRQPTEKKQLIYLTPAQVLMLIVGIMTIIIFCLFLVWYDYSKRLEMQFEQKKYDHEAEMARIALERVKMESELGKIQQNLKEIEHNKELVQVQQQHEMEMESMKLNHKKEFEKLRIENEREAEQWRSKLAESGKQLQLEREQKEMILKHETERIKFKDDNQRKISEKKITESVEMYNNALDALKKQIATEKEALERKREDCVAANKDARDSWRITSGSKYNEYAKEICSDYEAYRVTLNKLLDKLASLTQQRTKLIDDGESDKENDLNS